MIEPSTAARGLPSTAAAQAAGANSAPRLTRLRVRYADVDRMGVAYYANYFIWFEVGRTEWLRESGWTYRAMEEDGIALPVIQAHCTFQQPARYDDELEIETRATQLTPVRIRFDYEVRRPDDERGYASGYTIHAAVDRAGKPCRLPARVVAMLR